MAAEVAFCSLWHSLAALQQLSAYEMVWSLGIAYPGNEDVLRQRRVRVLDLDESELNASV